MDFSQIQAQVVLAIGLDLIYFLANSYEPEPRLDPAPAPDLIMCLEEQPIVFSPPHRSSTLGSFFLFPLSLKTEMKKRNDDVEVKQQWCHNFAPGVNSTKTCKLVRTDTYRGYFLSLPMNSRYLQALCVLISLKVIFLASFLKLSSLKASVDIE